MSAVLPARPQYRADVKGNIAAIKQDCIAMMRGELAHAFDFIFDPVDLTLSHLEYSQYLTDAELAQCFKAAQRKTNA